MDFTGAAPWRVLVTRPEPGASATAARLERLGFRPLLLPLSRTLPLPAAPLDGRNFDAVAATSAHALRLADPALLAAVRDLPFLAVGGRTAEAAGRAGFARVGEGPGDAAGLARLVLSRAPRGRAGSVLYLCGRVRRPEFEEALRAGGTAVLAVETYDTVPVDPKPDEVGAALGGGAVQAVLLTSALAARAFAGLLADAAAAPLLREAVPLALSRRILLALPVPGGFAADAPNEAALFALLAGLQRRAAPFQPSRV